MLVNFSEKYPPSVKSMHGKPTLFISQIWVGRKIHTMRQNASRFENRTGQILQICTGARTKKYLEEARVFQTGTQWVYIEKAAAPYKINFISIDGRVLTGRETVDFCRCDGFFSERAFVEWFFPKTAATPQTENIVRVLVHWTNKRY